MYTYIHVYIYTYVHVYQTVAYITNVTVLFANSSNNNLSKYTNNHYNYDLCETVGNYVNSLTISYIFSVSVHILFI